jgi:hypothetical protein
MYQMNVASTQINAVFPGNWQPPLDMTLSQFSLSETVYYYPH